jgi:phage-related baseplate assembly protein
MTITITDLFKTETRDEIFNSVIANLNTLALKTTSWVSGGMARTILLGISQKIADKTQQISVINKGGFRETSAGNWLTFLSRNLYNVERITAAPGTVSLTLTNALAVSYGPFGAGEAHFEHATSKKTYTNQASFTVPASGSVVISVIADEAGTASNANTNTITKIVSPSMPGVTLTHASALIGTDEEKDEPLRTRDLEKLGALSPNGPRGAYEYFSKGVKRTDGSIIDVNRVKVTKSSGAVTVTIASTSGTVAGADVTTVNTNIQTNCVPDGITATVQSATAQSVSVSGNVWVSSKWGTQADADAAIDAAIAAWIPTVPIGGAISDGPGGYVFVDAIKAQVFSALALNGASAVLDVDFDSPLADVAVGATAAPTVGSINISVTIVST